MRAATGGSLAAFLMIAPLVAIPVFAVVGIPQVAPAVSSPAGDDDPILPTQATAKAASSKDKSDADDSLDLPDRDTRGQSHTSARKNNRVVALTPERDNELPDMGARQPADRKSDSTHRRGKSSQEIDEALRSTDLAEMMPPDEALAGWKLVPDRNGRGKAKDAVTEPIFEDVPVAKPRSNRIRVITPTSHEVPNGAEETSDPFGVEPEPQATPHRRTRAALPRKKRSAAVATSDLNLASVDEPPIPASPASRPTSGAPRRPAPRVPAARTAAVDTPPVIEKISLNEFTPGLIHPTGRSEPAIIRKEVLEDNVDSRAAKRKVVEDLTTNKPSPTPSADLFPDEESFTWEMATQRLKELGIRSHKVDYLPKEGQYMFSCSFTPGNNPSISRRFEAVAERPRLAIQEVLRQIDEWQTQH